jgi:hypothetical protein
MWQAECEEEQFSSVILTGSLMFHSKSEKLYMSLTGLAKLHFT